MDQYEKSKMFTKRYTKIKTLLKITYGYESFRSKQYEIINRIICGEDVCAIMPTGMGKSLCYQIPALYIDKPAIIISPLISLMDDQRLILEEMGISSCCYNSNVINKNQMKKDIMQCKYKFIYITPESIINMKDFLEKLEDVQGISLIAIDEAHCISSYGFDFRKSYRELAFFKEILPKIPILAVTATATNIVGKDICKVLGFKNDVPIKTSFDRPNLFLEVRKKSKNIGSDIVPIIKKYSGKSIIIYCLTKKETAKVSEILKVHKFDCGIYHAGINADVKTQTHHDFIKDKTKIIVATIAFGMGINKSNVRVVIHYGAPKNIEGYYQEIGRAGRDGKKAYCYAFYNFGDFKVQERFIANSNDILYQKNQLRLLEQMKRYVLTKQCRRQILLEYFDEKAEDKCDFCDNCCGTHKETNEEIAPTEQDVQKEAKLLIDLVETVKNKSYGIGMYINILRGSKNKKITSIMCKSNFYGAGKHRSAIWWKEMSDNLVKQGFLQQVYLKGSHYSVQVIKVTKEGLTWANMADLNGFLDGINILQLQPMKMVATV
jgi:RecQ family ATP-dependent DNA helicase